MKKLEINNRRYLGSKYKLLKFIENTVNENCHGINSVADVFAGTGVVGDMFLKQGKEVYFNDFLKSNYYGYKAFFDNQKIDIPKVEKIIEAYNISNIKKDNYFSDTFANTYFSHNDCKKIGYIREDIETKFKQGIVNDREKDVLITSLLYSMDRIANTVGHYDAYRKLNKIDDKFYMYMVDARNNNNNVHIYSEDSNDLIKKIKADLVYIDPPYNSRQYSDAYHLLENIALWNKPKVYGVAKKMDRSILKSKYCTNKAVDAFNNLIENCDSKYILVSYNNTGDKSNSRSNAKISDLQIKEILERKGKVTVFEQEYNNFTTGKSVSIDHKERLFLCEINANNEKDKVFSIEDSGIYAKSPLNYTGGKYKLLPQFEEIFPKEINTFVDFFCGGANVSINSKAKNIVAIDNEKNLINILKLIQNHSYTEIVNKIERIIEEYELSNTYKNGYDYYNADSSSGLGFYNKKHYLRLRNDYNRMDNGEEKQFLFLTLIIYSFNHQIRFNSKGDFNMPVGKRDFNSSIRKNLLEFSKKLAVKKITFVNSDYKDFDLNTLKSGDFCYFDPPYYLGDASYNENDGWNEEKEIELLTFLNKLNEKNIRFALSNVTEHKGNKNNILINWAIENQYNIHNLNYNYNNSNYHKIDKSNNTKEVLITNY